jgi:alpha-tubulin suppressor-like RCC1 family protein
VWLRTRIAMGLGLGLVALVNCRGVARADDQEMLAISATALTLRVGDTASLGVTLARDGRAWHTRATGRQPNWPGDQPIAWSSSDESVAKISPLGVVQAGRGGRTTIHVQAAGLRDSGSVYVIAAVLEPAAPTSLETGRLHACALDGGGFVHCWGDSWRGQLGTGRARPFTSTLSPTRIAGSTRYAALAVGDLHTCALDREGRAYCWGDNMFGQLGDGTHSSSAAPVRVAGEVRFSALSAGGDHTCGLTHPGAVVCWGRDGNASATAPSGEVFVAVSAGHDHRCALTSTRAAFCWGRNTFGQLGTGASTPSATPSAVLGGHEFSTISAGSQYTCGITTGGAAYCWGWGASGRLGTGSESSSTIPAVVTGRLHFAQLDAGTTHTCGITTDHRAYCWGRDLAGELGDGPNTMPSPSTGDLVRLAPIRVSSPISFATVSAGAGSHTCAISTAGIAYCWGANGSGALGYGRQDWYPGQSFSMRDTPTEVAPLQRAESEP